METARVPRNGRTVNIANYPCDLCEQLGIAYVTVPKRYYPLLPHSCLYLLGRELERLWLCEKCEEATARNV